MTNLMIIQCHVWYDTSCLLKTYYTSTHDKIKYGYCDLKLWELQITYMQWSSYGVAIPLSDVFSFSHTRALITGSKHAGIAAVLWTCIWKITTLNLDQDTVPNEILCGFPHTPCQRLGSNLVRPQKFPSQSFTSYHIMVTVWHQTL